MAYAEPENMTGVMDMFEYANDVSGNSFGVGILVSLFVVIFMFLHGKGEETLKCFIVAGFITSVTSVFLFIGGLVNDWHMFMCFIITVLCTLWAKWHGAG